ncbi:hypothetical protein KEM52_005782 [Ascosphaera acerosa]|nr:hypothetical protein KEM52_005782 [Ascosphaera acerosa]
MADQPAWRDTVLRKRQQLDARIPREWRLPENMLPASLPSLDDSISATTFAPTNVLEVPRACGLLTQRELLITERWGVRGLLEELRAGRLTASDVCRAFCKRAAVAHQLTRCLAEPLFDDALTRAADLDARFSRNRGPVGPLHGLPISIKDCFDVEGVDSTVGVVDHALKPKRSTAPLVTLLRSLGAVVIAKTNVPQFVYAFDSVNYVFGRTLNPLNYNVSAGGSSGGEAALVAMRGSMVGIGTDIGGSIRVPAACCGLYGLKPSAGRVPYGGQTSVEVPGKDRMIVKAAAGPIARSLDDLTAIMEAVVPASADFASDCLPGQWAAVGAAQPLTFGVLRHDGLVEPLPPVAKALDDVVRALRSVPGVRVVELPVPAMLAKLQGLANKLSALDGNRDMFDTLGRTSEPMIPWLKTRVRRSPPLTLDQILALQAQRDQVEAEALEVLWRTQPQHADCADGGSIDAILHPVAPHPVHLLDQFNANSYTMKWTALDYPAATVPVRKMAEGDLGLGKDVTGQPWNSWDKKNREYWDSKLVDRRVYLDSWLSVQVVARRLCEHTLTEAMGVVDKALHRGGGEDTPVSRL